MTRSWRRPLRRLRLGARLLRRRGRVTAGLAAGLAVAGCSLVGGQDPGTSGSSSSPAISSASASPSGSGTASPSPSSHPTAPLTGLWASGAPAAARPAVALDVAGPAPQGLTSADVVFQMAASPARYIAVYQSRLPAAAGPITTTQPADRNVLAVLHPLVGYNGAALPYFVTLLDNTKTKAKVTDAGFSHYPSAYSVTPQGMTASPRAILRAVSDDTAPPPLFRYQGAASGARTLASTGVWRPSSVQVSIPGEGTMEWSFSAHADRWALTSGGPKVQVANLVVQRVPYKEIGVNRRRGISVSTPHVVGSGAAEVFSGSVSGGSGGTAAPGTWSKPRGGLVTNYIDSGGSLMAFQPGPTWVILAPPGTHVSTSR
jgi:Protein of unknown function (DUF3048) C-terminal domain/Protein of unknown function (DUF3048) N-terminal domain